MSLDITLGPPNICPSCGHKFGLQYEVHSQNITHNLGMMAKEAEIYAILWRPEENGIQTANQLITPLEAAIAKMREDPERFKKHNAANGWGMYEHFVPWLERLLEVCRANPELSVQASR